MLFMHKRQVNRQLYQKVLRYIEHLYDTESVISFEQTGFVEHLSQSLQAELRLAVTGNFLRRFPFFEKACDTWIKASCMACRTQRAGVGDVVVEEGQVSADMFLIVCGEVMMTRDLGHDGTQNVTTLVKGDWFGERALFYEGLVHNATVTCDKHCEFLVIGRKDFLEQVQNTPILMEDYDRVMELLRLEPLKAVTL